MDEVDLEILDRVLLNLMLAIARSSWLYQNPNQFPSNRYTSQLVELQKYARAALRMACTILGKVVNIYQSMEYAEIRHSRLTAPPPERGARVQRCTSKFRFRLHLVQKWHGNGRVGSYIAGGSCPEPSGENGGLPLPFRLHRPQAIILRQ